MQSETTWPSPISKQHPRLKGTPFVHATIDSPSGLHELWLMQFDESGCMVPIAGPVPWPAGWVSLKNMRREM